jgi:PKD repeat protein
VQIGLLNISQPNADFKTADTASCPGKAIVFENLSTGPTNLIYFWDFGDGNTSTDVYPIHSYGANGFYTVKLLISDPLGCADTMVKVNYIRISTPNARFNVSDTLGTCPPLVVNFTNSSNNYTSLLWDFGDGTTSLSPDPSHFYNTPGIFTATLTVTGPGGCISVKSQQIIVRTGGK